MQFDSKYISPTYLPMEQRLRAFEQFPEVERVVIGHLKRKRWMRFRDGHLRVRRELETGYVIAAYSFEGRRDAIIRCAREHMPAVRDLIEAVSCGETGARAWIEAASFTAVSSTPASFRRGRPRAWMCNRRGVSNG